MNNKLDLLVFRHEYSENGVGSLVPVEVPCTLTLDTIEEWLTTLKYGCGYSYSVMMVGFTCRYNIKEKTTVYAESVDPAEPPKYDPED